MRYRISEKAIEDIENIWSYTRKIGLWNKQTDIII
jgi:plasmid stabilization system protein ParE